MSNPVISVEHIWKQYRVGLVGAGTLSSDLKRWMHRIRGKEDPFSKIADTNDRTVKGNSDYVWALQDVSFQVSEGEVLGIMGKNGAGKSTLLKILSRVTAPTKGEIKIRGRIASLLEVGTGFHPDLTGRENVFLNGTILGMKRAEIRAKFDEIVAFSGVERYIDTPVKRYSSGMYVRLAFAVAAHLDPEILVVDEVLAVGDAEFQKKCLGKMKDVSGKGRTILFVSHNLAAVRNICTRAVLIEKGTVRFEGDTNEAIDLYMSDNTGSASFDGMVMWGDAEMPGNKFYKVRSVRLLNEKGEVSSVFLTNKSVSVEVRYEVMSPITGLRVSVTFIDRQGTIAFVSTNQISETEEKQPGQYVSTCRVPANLLNGGGYEVSVRIGKPWAQDLAVALDNILAFDTTLMGNNGSVARSAWPGVVAPALEWITEKTA